MTTTPETTPVRLADMTAQVFAQACAREPVILLPLASHEDHGPFQPMGDFVLAEILAEQIARAAGELGAEAYVAPCLPYGVADYFGSSPGGLALAPASFRAVLEDLLAGLLRHGLRKIIILNGHGGNVPVIHEVTLALRQRTGDIVPSFYLWKVARQIMARQIGNDSPRFSHGAEPLLSMNMALRGEFVSAAKPLPSPPPVGLLGLQANGFGGLAFQDVTVEAPLEFDALPRDSLVAARDAASAALGASTIEALVEVGAAFVAHYAANAAVRG